MKKVIILIVGFILGLFASNWIFNHVNPWLGWIGYILTFGLTINYVVKLNKRIAKEESFIDTEKTDKK